MTDAAETAKTGLLAALKSLKLGINLKERVDDIERQMRFLIKARGPRGVPGLPGRDGQDGVDGKPGSPGARGNGLKKIEDGVDSFTLIDVDGHKTIIPKPKAVHGKDGLPGKDGVDGVGIANAYVEDGTLYLKLTNGETINAGYVRGDKGEKGNPGAAGAPGQAPKHELVQEPSVWKLRFKNPNGSWANWMRIPRKQNISSVVSGQPATANATLARRQVIAASVDTILPVGERMIVKVDTTNSDVRIYLPTRNPDYDMDVIIKKTPSDDNEVYVESSDGRLINDESEFNISLSNSAIHFIDDVNGWDAV